MISSIATNSYCRPNCLHQIKWRRAVSTDRPRRSAGWHSPLWFGVRWPLPAGCWWTLPWPCHCCREPGSPSPRSLGSCWVYRLVSLCSCGRHDTPWMSSTPRAAGGAIKLTLRALKNVQHAIFLLSPMIYILAKRWELSAACVQSGEWSRSQLLGDERKEDCWVIMQDVFKHKEKRANFLTGHSGF